MMAHMKFREPINAISHLTAALAAFIGTIILLILGSESLVKEISFLIYGTSLVLMFSASAAYHALITDKQKLILLRKFDHTAIYLLIAGSYTPICLYFFKGFWQWGLLTLIWLMAAAGIIVKLFIINAPRWITAGVYLIMGWTAIMAVMEIINNMPVAAIIWLVAGGLFYTIGAIVYITKKLDLFPGVFGFHEIWHIFVILGALSHYILIVVFIAI
jgi:hemolysin III